MEQPFDTVYSRPTVSLAFVGLLLLYHLYIYIHLKFLECIYRRTVPFSLSLEAIESILVSFFGETDVFQFNCSKEGTHPPLKLLKRGRNYIYINIEDKSYLQEFLSYKLHFCVLFLAKMMFSILIVVRKVSTPPPYCQKGVEIINISFLKLIFEHKDFFEKKI